VNWRTNTGGAPEDRSYRAFVDALILAAQGIRVVIETHVERFKRPEANREGWYEAVQSIAEDLGARLEEQLRLLRIQRVDELEIFAAPMTRLAKSMVPNCELLFFPWAKDRYELEIYNVAFAGGLSTRLANDLARVYGPRHPVPEASALHASSAGRLSSHGVRP
jgi:hypothetical protein